MNFIVIAIFVLIVWACTDYPASEGNDSEANPIEININIQSDSESSADSDSVINEGSDNVSSSSSSSAIDNSTDNSTDNTTINLDNASAKWISS
jgi:hypothetical protein